MTNYGRYLKDSVELTKWLVTFVDTDHWMLTLLAMDTDA